MVLQDHASGPKGASYRDPETEVQKDPDAEILYMWVVLQDPDTSGPKRSSYRDLSQVVLQDPDRSGQKGS